METELKSSFQYQPALDGVRGLAVVAVLLFHAGVPWITAGYLGVSVFFTLSGYLITSLLLAEQRSNGRVDLSAFFSRRLRRLLPASMVCAAAILIARRLGAFASVEGLGADALTSLLGVHNWAELLSGTSYNDLFASAASPFDHYWSLSIEEQFYWVWPALLLGLVAVSRRAGRPVRLTVTLLTLIVSAAAIVIARVADADTTYWATPARLPEILIGATAACWMVDRPVPVRSRSILATSALTSIIAAMIVWPSASGPAYSGALPGYALLTVALIVGLQADGRLRRALSASVPVWVGRRSYGLYLYHWPIFLLVRDRGWDLSAPGNLVAVVLITAAVAAISYVAIEQPIRRADWAIGRTLSSAAVGSAFVLVAALTVPASSATIRPDTVMLDAAAIRPADSLVALAPLTTTAATPDPTAAATSVVGAEVTPESTRVVTHAEPAVTAVTAVTAEAPARATASSLDTPIVPTRPVRIAVVGDSTALYVGNGLAAWSVANPELAQTEIRWSQGCTFMLEPEVTTFAIDDLLSNARRVIGQQVPDMIDQLSPDVVVLMVTVNDAADRRWSDSEGPLTPHDPRYVERLTAAYAALTADLLDRGVPTVAWIVPPSPTVEWKEAEMNDLGRYAVQHQVIRDVVGSFASRVELIDLESWLSDATTNEVDRDAAWWRPDGVHFTNDSAAVLADELLGPLLVRTALGG